MRSVCLSVCVSVCLPAIISLVPLNRPCGSPVAVARSSSGGVAIPGWSLISMNALLPVELRTVTKENDLRCESMNNVVGEKNICFFQEKSHRAIIPRAKSCILHCIIIRFIVMQHYSDCDNKFHDATYSSSASSTASCSHNKLTSILCFYSAPLGERMYCDQFFCLYVCLSVCLPRAYLWNRWTDLHEIFYADPLWPWLGPPLAALRYVM